MTPLRAALVIAANDLRVLRRNPVALFFVLGFPILFATLFGSMGLADLTRRTLDVAVVDASGNPAGAALVARLGAEGSHLRTQRHPDRDSARAAVLDGRCAAYVLLPEGFPATPIELGADPSQPAAAALIEGRLLQASLAAIVPGFGALEDRLRRAPVHRARPASSYEVAVPAAMLWALLGASASFAVAIAVERTSGTLLRLRLAPVSQRAMLAGKALACLTTSCAAACVLLALGVLGFGVRLADPLSLAVALLSGAVAFAGLMMLVATFGLDEQATAGAGWAILLLMAMTGGGMVPLVLMPRWMYDLSSASPVRWAIVAFEGAIWRGTPWPEQLQVCGQLIALGGACFALAAHRLSSVEAQ